MGVLLRLGASAAMWVFLYGYTTWWVMLMFGVTHASSGLLPPLGYWQVFPIVLGFSSIVAAPLIYLRFSDDLLDI